MARAVTWVRIARWARLAPRYSVIAVLRAYQLLISPMLGPVCRFAPSCSSYAVEAVRSYGTVRGGWMTVRRLLRCHPWNPGGHDPVPPHPVRLRRSGTTATTPAMRVCEEHLG